MALRIRSMGRQDNWSVLKKWLITAVAIGRVVWLHWNLLLGMLLARRAAAAATGQYPGACSTPAYTRVIAWVLKLYCTSYNVVSLGGSNGRETPLDDTVLHSGTDAAVLVRAVVVVVVADL